MKAIDYIFVIVFIYACSVTYLYFGGNNNVPADNKPIEASVRLYQDSLLDERIKGDSLKIIISATEEKILKSKSNVQIIKKYYDSQKTKISLLSNDSSVLYFHSYINSSN